MQPVMQSDQRRNCLTSTSLRFQTSDFRLQTLAQHMMPVTPSVPNLFRRNPRCCKDAFTVKSHFDFRLRLHFCFSDLSFQKVEWQSHDFRFQVRFQISGSRKGVKSKSGLRLQISDFRLPQGSEIEIGTSISDFRFQTPARERNRKCEFHFNFGLRLQKSVLRATKSNLEMISGFHFDFRTELSMARGPDVGA